MADIVQFPTSPETPPYLGPSGLRIWREGVRLTNPNVFPAVHALWLAYAHAADTADEYRAELAGWPRHDPMHKELRDSYAQEIGLMALLAETLGLVPGRNYVTNED